MYGAVDPQDEKKEELSEYSNVGESEYSNVGESEETVEYSNIGENEKMQPKKRCVY